MSKSKGQEEETVMSGGLPSGLTNSVEKVDRVRDIIFGTQMRDYTQRFDTISRELARLGQEVTRLNEQMQEQEKRLRKELRQESDRLLAQMQDQDKAQQQQLQAVDQRLSEQLQLLDQKHTTSAQSLASHLATVEQLLRNELHDLSAQLNHNKVDRPSLGELLIELGTSLKTKEPAALQVPNDLLDQLNEELF
jgi:DNA anti-recombination protein RmuC